MMCVHQRGCERCPLWLARAAASAAQPRENRRKQVPGPGAVEIEIDDDARAVVQEDITRLDDVRHNHPVHSRGMVQCSQALAQFGPGHGLGVTVRPPPPLVSIGHEQDGHVAVDRRRVPRIPFRKAVVQMVVDDLRAPAVWRAGSHLRGKQGGAPAASWLLPEPLQGSRLRRQAATSFR